MQLLIYLTGYNFNADSISTTDDSILTYHRMSEAFKFAYAKRSALGDEAFVNVTEVSRSHIVALITNILGTVFNLQVFINNYY